MACVGLAVYGQACTGNIVTNPGFENGLTGWNADGGNVTIITAANSGTKAAKVGGTGYGSVGFVLPTTPGTAYDASFFAKATGGGSKAVALRFLNSDWTTLSPAAQVTTNNSFYTEYTLSGIAPAAAAYVYLIAYKDGSGSVEVDDFCLTTGGGSCNIAVSTTPPVCFDLGTPTNPSDDSFTFTFTVNGSSGSWVATLPDANQNGTNTVFAGQNGEVITSGYFIADVNQFLNGAVVFNVVDSQNPSCTANVSVPAPSPCSNGGGSGQIDLSLVAQQLTASPAIYSNYPVKLTLSNAGPQAATGVKVKFAKPAGVVYVGGNQFTASQGTFNPNGDEVWTVDNIPANGSATLTANFFLLQATAPAAYAQVTAHTETDGDSQPNNGTPPTPVQDDEASTAGGGGGPTPQSDLTIADLQIPTASVAAGAILNYNFDAGNAGTAAVPGSFTIKSYISTDQTLSANDFQDGNINTGNYAAGFAVQNVAGASTIPASLVAGSYYLIVKIDGDNAIAEGNESNNTVVKPLTVTGGTQGPDLQLSLETDASNIWPQNPIFFVTATVENTGTELATGVQVTFSGLQGANFANGNFQPVASQGAFNQVGQVWNVGAMAAGGQATLKVFLFNLDGGPDYRYFAQVSAMNGTDADSSPGNAACCSVAEDDEAIVPPGPCNIQAEVLQVLNCISGSSPPSDLLVYEVQVTGTMGGFHGWYGEPGPIYSFNGDAVFERTVPRYETRPDKIHDNANPKCVFELAFPKPPCTPSDPCAAITITPAPSKITIAGFSAPHVLIKVFRPNWTVLYECLDGQCASPTVVSNLTPETYHVQVKLINSSWGEICFKQQDVGVTNLGGGGGSALLFDDGRQRLAFDRIYPNPAQHFVTLEMYSKDDQPATLDFYDQQGRLVYREEARLAAGQNEVTVGVSDWKSGAYNVIARGEGMPAYGRFLKVWEE